MKNIFRSSFSLLLCLLTLASFAIPTLAGVDIVQGEYGTEERYAVTVASSSSRTNCETCVERMQKAGYNAYMYQKYTSKKSYYILIGAFTTREEADDFAEIVRADTPVRGVSMGSAYGIRVNLSWNDINKFSNCYYGSDYYYEPSYTYTPEPTPTSKYSSSDDSVDLYLEPNGTTKCITVQVARSSKFSRCETCVKRLRDAGYNAFVYQENPDKEKYFIVIGLFSSVKEAREFADCLHNVPPVKGVDLEGAYATNVMLSKSAIDLYTNPYWWG